MKCYRGLFLIVLSSILIGVQAQENKEVKWSIFSGFEVNFTGNNVLLHMQHFRKEIHLIEGGLSYNISDGFADRPVLGLGLGYGYRLVSRNKWTVYTGVDYRLQRPIRILNIQTLTYTNSVLYRPVPKIQLSTRIGYGVATSRARSAGAFTQTNSPTGSFLLTCGYLF